MKTLIIHPSDPSTKFLTGIYSTLTNKTVITGGVTKAELQKHIDIHDRVIMLGHGSSLGLLSVNQFTDCGYYIIDDSMVESLRSKTNSIYIWCDANQFVLHHSLKGFNSGMFISEAGEAWYYDLWDNDLDCINESNNGFSAIVSNHINERLDILYKNVTTEYGVLAMRNPIALFNLNRLYLTMSKRKVFTEKLGTIL